MKLNLVLSYMVRSVLITVQLILSPLNHSHSGCTVLSLTKELGSVEFHIGELRKTYLVICSCLLGISWVAYNLTFELSFIEKIIFYQEVLYVYFIKPINVLCVIIYSLIDTNFQIPTIFAKDIWQEQPN